jgi:hypothetical protein
MTFTVHLAGFFLHPKEKGVEKHERKSTYERKGKTEENF